MPKEKSYVAMQQELCIVCTKPIDIGILFDKRLRDSLPDKVVTGYHETPCPECNEKMRPSDGSGERVALVGIDESKSELLPNGNVDPNNAYRTGSIAFLRVKAWEQMIDIPVPDKLVCFCGEETISHLLSLQGEEPCQSN